jgi:hypothetical protein
MCPPRVRARNLVTEHGWWVRPSRLARAAGSSFDRGGRLASASTRRAAGADKRVTAILEACAIRRPEKFLRYVRSLAGEDVSRTLLERAIWASLWQGDLRPRTVLVALHEFFGVGNAPPSHQRSRRHKASPTPRDKRPKRPKSTERRSKSVWTISIPMGGKPGYYR